jgi:hypothetical protein
MAPWSKAELNRLAEFAGDLPRPRLAGAYNKWATDNDYPVRTAKAIWMKANKSGFKLRAIGTFMKTGAIAEVLGIPATTVEQWGVRYSDFPRQKIGAHYYINRKDLRCWASKHMHLFGGIPCNKLMQLLESQQLADRICKLHPMRPTGLEINAKPVRCITTNTVYPSISAAARAVHVTYQAIVSAMRQQRQCCGLQFELINARRSNTVPEM